VEYADQFYIEYFFSAQQNEFITITKTLKPAADVDYRINVIVQQSMRNLGFRFCNADPFFYSNYRSASLRDCGAYGRANSDKRLGSH
jgi:hypothetical protein